MEKTALLKNIGIGFLCLIVAALLGFSIYQHRLLKNITAVENTKPASNESATGLMPGPEAESITDETASAAAAHTAQPDSTDIDALEAELDATESELNAAYRQMDDELARKEALEEKQRELRRQYMESPAYRNSMRTSVESQYRKVLDELGLSEEDRGMFADIYVDYYMANSEISPEIPNATTDAQKEDLRQRKADILGSRESQIQELLGSGYETYHEYVEMGTTRSVINSFKASLSQDAQLAETQEKELMQIMYKEMMQVFGEMGYDPRYEIEFPSEVKDGTVDGKAANMARINSNSLEKSKDVLSESQYEQFESYLKNMQEMTELATQLSD